MLLKIKHSLQSILLHFKVTIKIKILALIVVIGVLLSLLLAIFSPRQTQRLGRDILKNDAEFITNLLAENLALGMQTMSIDDGAALEQTLGLLKSEEEKKWDAVTNIRVYDDQGRFVAGLHGRADSTVLAESITGLVIREYQQFFKTFAPLQDIDKNVIGTVEIDFSKTFLNQKITQNSTTTLIITCFVLALTLFLGVLVSRDVAGRIENAVSVMKDIAQGEGDLTKRLDIHSRDEVGQLQEWMNHFMDKIHDLMAEVKQNTDLVSHTASAIHATSSQMAVGAEQQASRASETISTVEHITDSIGRNAHHAKETTDMAEEATLIAKEGKETMQAMLRGMYNIIAVTQGVGYLIESLFKRTSRIDEILKTIEDLSVQIGFLSINASIEASHAGDLGKGFMVVSDHMRDLAEQTQTAIQTIEETIQSIQKDMNTTSKSMQEAESTMGQGRESAMKTQEVLNRIIATMENSIKMIQHIAESFTEENAGAQLITDSAEEIGTVTKRVLEGATSIAQVAEGLNTQTEILRRSVGQFKLKNN